MLVFLIESSCFAPCYSYISGDVICVVNYLSKNQCKNNIVEVSLFSDECMAPSMNVFSGSHMRKLQRFDFQSHAHHQDHAHDQLVPAVNPSIYITYDM